MSDFCRSRPPGFLATRAHPAAIPVPRQNFLAVPIREVHLINVFLSPRRPNCGGGVFLSMLEAWR